MTRLCSRYKTSFFAQDAHDQNIELKSPDGFLAAAALDNFARPHKAHYAHTLDASGGLA